MPVQSNPHLKQQGLFDHMGRLLRGFPAALLPMAVKLRHARSRFFRKNSRFAGRSASRRMKYGYQASPNGT